MPTTTTIWRLVLAMAFALGTGYLRAGEVTVVGQTWQDRHRPVFNDSIFSPNEITLPPGVLASANEPHSTAEASPAEEEPAVAQPVEADIEFLSLLTWAGRPLESCLYVRFDYLSWDEQIGRHNVLSENGTLYTFGYTRNSGAQRIRVEFSTGETKYDGMTQDGYALKSTTAYRGVRCEYEWLYDLNRSFLQPATVFVGIGSRFWIRDIRDGYVPDLQDYAIGYQETWVTLYPYIGLEKKWLAKSLDEYFVSARIGSTGWTYEHASMIGTPGLYPVGGLIGQVEGGFRSEQFFASVYFDVMSWRQSPAADGYYQPNSQMLTLGLKLGLFF